MRRAILPLIFIVAISVIAAGMVLSASSGTSGTTSSQVVQAPVIETFQLTQAGPNQNWRYPGVAEDSKGNRLVIFRGPEGTLYWYTYCPKGGAWTSPALIPDQPSLINSLYADIAVDSTDRFHCLWEKTYEAAVYGSFRDGEGWKEIQKLRPTGHYDLVDSIAVRSTDEVIAVDTRVVGYGKDIYLHTKGKNQSLFSAPKNLTNDSEGSTQAWIAVDSKDHIWMVHKSDYPYNPDPSHDILIIFLSHWDQNNKEVIIDPVEVWQIVSDTTGWSFLPQVAVNNEDKVMTAWAFAGGGNDYVSRLYDPATKTLGPQIPVNIGLTRSPWHTFFLRLAAHGKDFYLAVIDAARILYLYKFDETTSRWTRVAQVSDRPVEQFDLYSGDDRMLVAWGSWEEPTNVYLTAVEVPPLKKTLTVQSGTGGTTDPSPGVYHYDKGSSVTIRAVPDAGYRFTSWSGDASGNANPLTITLNGDMTVKANFTPQQTLTIQAGAGGTTDPSPGTYQIDRGSSASIRPLPDAAYRFISWSGDASGESSPLTVTMDRDLTVKANFRLRVQSPINLKVEKKIERGFFSGYYLNVLSWEANPQNSEHGVVIAAQRIYRKLPTESSPQWALLAEAAPGILTYVDRNVPRTSGYVYAVTCVDANGFESSIY